MSEMGRAVGQQDMFVAAEGRLATNERGEVRGRQGLRHGADAVDALGVTWRIVVVEGRGVGEEKRGHGDVLL